MSNPINKKQVGQVSNWFPSNERFLNYSQSSMSSPYGLKLQQTILSTGSVTIPADITWVYVICVGGGGGGSNTYRGGGAGGVAWGWTLPSPSCIVGSSSQGTAGGYTRYGWVIAGGGGGGTSGAATIGGGLQPDTSNGVTNYWGMPPGNTTSRNGAGALGGTSASPTAIAGGNGISGGGGGFANPATETATGGNGGYGLVGGGGGGATTSTGIRIGGNGGNGFNIITGEVTLGGTGATGVNSGGGAGGGAGIAGNGFNAVGLAGGNGGLGGGGGGGGSNGGNQTVGGNGIIYLYY